MPASILLGLGSQIFHCILDGMAACCLYFAAVISDHDSAIQLYAEAIKNGDLATAIGYFEESTLRDVTRL